MIVGWEEPSEILDAAQGDARPFAQIGQRRVRRRLGAEIGALDGAGKLR